MHHRTTLSLLAAAGVALAGPAAASAAPFAAPTPLAGFGTVPALARVQASALFTDGRSAVVGSRSDPAAGGTETDRIAFAAGQPGALPAPATALGRLGPYDLDVDTDPDGPVSSTWSVGSVAYLSRCSDGGCAPTVRVGTAPAKPSSAVAVQPGTGRTIVMWRGRTSTGRARLQWRITSGSRLGAIHTLGETGSLPQLATDASGRTVALWVGADGIHTASRREREFTRPTTLAPGAGVATAPRLVVNATTGRWTAAWLASATDVLDPAGTVTTATRTNSTAFSAPQAVGAADAFSLAAAPGGNALLVAQRGGTNATVLAARSTGAAFGPLQAVATPVASLSTTYPAAGAIDDAGNAVVSWTSASGAGTTVASGTSAVTTTTPGGAFGAPQLLAAGGDARLTAPSIGRGIAQVAFGSTSGPQLARAAL